MKLLFWTVMSGPWRKSKNQTKIYYPPTLPQNQLVNTTYPNTQLNLLPNQRQQLYYILQEDSGVLGPSIADLSSSPLVKHYIGTGNAKPIKQRAYRASHHHRKEIEKQVEEML